MSRYRTASHRGLAGIRALAVVSLLAVAAACSGGATSSSGGSGSGSGPMVVGILAPFTGQDAALGPAYFAGCLPAVRSINAAGGVLGHQLSCKQFDTRGEPADAVPAARQMVASTPNLMMVIGCTSDEASSVIPILEQSHIPSFCMTGQSEFNKSQFKYFHRLVPPDEYDAFAMVGIALYYDHFKNAALVFGNDIGSQAFVDPAKNALTRLGGQVAINQALALGQSSYRTEVTQMLATKPDVIFTEALGSTDATYLAEVKQLNGGKMIPVIGTSATIDPTWFKAVGDAIGYSDLLQYFQANDIQTTFAGPGYDEFKTNLLASVPQFGDAAKYVQHASTLHLYDGIIMTALAMKASNSADPKVYNSWIFKTGNGTSGATVVNTYKAGLNALNGGKQVRLVGAGGATNFNKYNNSQGGYIIVKYTAAGDEQQISQLSEKTVASIIQAGGG